MPADQHGSLRGSAEREPLVPGLVDRLLRAGLGDEAAEPLASPLPRVRPRDALRAVLVPGELAELLQLGDRALRIEPHPEETLTRPIRLAVWDALRDRSADRLAGSPSAGLVLVLLGGLWALWEGYKWLWERTGWTRPFRVDDTDDPAPARHRRAARRADARGEPLSARFMLDAALFTAK